MLTELWLTNFGIFDINQLLFDNDTALAAESEEKLCKFLSESGRVCRRRNGCDIKWRIIR